jgi:glutamate N-acetyltransferase/amino-acid N-acetyltransferase
MAVHLHVAQAHELHPIAGVRIGVTEAGVRKAHRKDLTLFELAPGTQVGAVFTQNRFCAAPVQLCRQHLAQADGIRALVINTGVANAGTGDSGLRHAQAVCDAVGQQLQIASNQVLPF